MATKKKACSAATATALSVKVWDTFASFVAHDVLVDALKEDGRAVPARLRAARQTALGVYQRADRARKRCGRPVLAQKVPRDYPHEVERRAAAIQKRLKIKA